VINISNLDPRFRFEVFASSKDLKMNIVTFDPIVPINMGLGNESRVLVTERIELTRF
jgi:hypothetical protein